MTGRENGPLGDDATDRLRGVRCAARQRVQLFGEVADRRRLIGREADRVPLTLRAGAAPLFLLRGAAEVFGARRGSGSSSLPRSRAGAASSAERRTAYRSRFGPGQPIYASCVRQWTSNL